MTRLELIHHRVSLLRWSINENKEDMRRFIELKGILHDLCGKDQPPSAVIAKEMKKATQRIVNCVRFNYQSCKKLEKLLSQLRSERREGVTN